MEIQHCRVCEGKEFEYCIPPLIDEAEIICVHCGSFRVRERDLAMTPRWELKPVEVEKVVEFIRRKNKIGEKPLLEKNAGVIFSGEYKVVKTSW